MLRKLTFLTIITVLALAIPVVTTAVSLEQGKTAGQAQINPEIRPVPIPIPYDCCDPGRALSCVSQADVGRPVRTGALWVFPITGKPCTRQNAFSMDEALRRGDLVIFEQASPSVASLTGENRSGQYIIIIAGEVLLGGKQNRIVASDILLPPHSGPIPIPVFCGERHRWTHTKNGFLGKQMAAPAQMRSQVYSGTTQNEIWSGISDRINRYSVKAPTENLEELYVQGSSAETVKRCRRMIGGRFPYNSIGFVVYAGRRPVGVEIFGNRHLFNELHQKMLDSYFVDYEHYGCKRPPDRSYPPSRQEVKTWIENLFRANFSSTNTPGAGCLFQVRHQQLFGQTLLLGCDLMHFGAMTGHAPFYKRTHR